MEAFLSKVRGCIERENLLLRGDRLVVAVSGGADSVALLLALLHLGYECEAAHCNFHLRGEESDRDMRAVETLCAEHGVVLHIKDFDVEARRCATGESIEMACRELRYDWFGELIKNSGADAIAVGHHSEDRVETFFLNLMRGSGMTGLTALRARSGRVVRPLLDCTRTEIEDFLGKIGATWVVDSTNLSNDYQRNSLRNQLLPMLEELFPAASSGVLRSIDILAESKRFYDRAVNEEVAKYVSAEGEIDLRRLASDCPDAPLLLFEALRSEGFNRTQTNDMLRAATNNNGGKFVTSAGHIRYVDHGILRAVPAAEPEQRPTFALSIHDVSEFAPTRNQDVIYLDIAAAAPENEWGLRHWQQGDRMTPFGMVKSKLLSDIFAGEHLCEADKRSTWLLTCNGEIVWAVGLRASAQFPVTKNSKQFIRLEYIKTKKS